MIRLGEITQLQFGYYAPTDMEADIPYLQAKHFDDYGKQVGPIDTFIETDEKSAAHLLEDGDILLVGKGMRNFAWTYRRDFGPAVASSIFFVIKADRNRVIPEYLTTLFNMPNTQAHFQTLGAGSSIPSIRKSELEAFKIQLPSLGKQRMVVGLKELHDKELRLHYSIIEEKERIFKAVMNTIILNK